VADYLKAKFNIAYHLENDETGEIVRNVRADIYIETSDDCSMDYLKDSLISTCNGVIDIIQDV
jgi:hypothetical protein